MKIPRERKKSITFIVSSAVNLSWKVIILSDSLLKNCCFYSVIVYIIFYLMFGPGKIKIKNIEVKIEKLKGKNKT